MIGKTVGKYRILERLGRGGMGTVYKAVDETLDREVAIKVLNPDLGDTEVLKRFRAEAVTLARLNHPGIATLYELHRQDDELLMVMEFVRGETFHDLSERHGPLAPPQAAHLCMQVLDALGHAHRAGIVHRDLKPANLMVTDHGIVKVMDFGIARVLGTEHFTHGGYMMGTPAYMAPEQVLGQEVDGRADLYSMGVVFYRLLATKLPFDADTAIGMVQKQISDEPTPIATYRPDLPAWCTAILARALVKAPEDRFQSAEEFRVALLKAVTPQSLGELPTMATPTPPGIPRVPEATMTAEVSRSRAVSRSTRIDPTGASVSPARATSPEAPATSAPGEGMPSGRHERTTTTIVLGRTHMFALGALVLLLATGIAVFAFAAFGGGSTLTEQLQQLGQAVPGAPEAAVGDAPAPAAAPDDIPLEPPPADGPPVTDPPAPVTQPDRAALAVAGAQPPQKPEAQRAVDRAASATDTKITDLKGENVKGGPTAAAESSSREASPPSTSPPEAAPAVEFRNVRILVDDSGRARERDGVLQLGGGRVSVVDREDSTSLASLPYNAITGAFYSRSRQPKWKDTEGNEVESKVDLGRFGVFRGERNWLILLTSTEPIIIRLEDSGLRTILPAVQEHTGVPIRR